ncbi:MAG: META domain-containing protein [Bacteroidetes bacterium]|nr:META domain-containing protein [Bacteroidota bacterium]
MKKGVILTMGMLICSLVFSDSRGANQVSRTLTTDYSESFREQNPVLTTKKLNPKNSRFVIEGKKIRLKRGVSKIKLDKNSATKLITQYTGKNVVGDINGDGADDMAIILSQQSGGNEIRYYASVISSEKGKYKSSNTVFIGDRINVYSIALNNGNIMMEYADLPKEDTTVFAPTVLLSKILKFESGVLSQKQNEISLFGRSWKWEKTIMNNGKSTVPNNEDAFSLFFSDDGKIFITTDCNTFSGIHKISDNKLTLGPLKSTRKFCEESQEDIFIKSLNEVDTWFINEKQQLILQLKFDSGSIIFGYK